jgi:hypothetical protein
MRQGNEVVSKDGFIFSDVEAPKGRVRLEQVV